MTTPLDVCNLALGRIGTRSAIASLTEASPEAYYCRLFYAQARDATLMAEDWRFATAFQALALSGTAPGRWRYQYAMPADCLKAHGIVDPRCIAPDAVNPATFPPVRFERGLGLDGGGAQVPAIWTDEAGAVLKYTAQVENPGLWEAAFITALSWELAAEIAVPITGNAALQQAMFVGFQQSVAAARNASANQGVLTSDAVPDWLRCRGLAREAAGLPLLTQYPR